MKQKLIERWEAEGIVHNKEIIKAFKKIKREQFIPKEMKDQAYGDYPLPIGCEQTISQPSTIVFMLELLDLKPGQKVLEIGSGSGYNSALIAQIVGNEGEVITVDVHVDLVEKAKKNLKKANIRNVKVVLADGSLGYKEEAPYDRIIATCACPDIPKPWEKQLRVSGIIVAPVGNYNTQEMVRLKKTRSKLQIETYGYFRFVPLKGKYGFR
ncbi:protein-L-isoaspartate O-methyltransferase [Candidatus Woesearchaeota archaeon]|nr:MAG: protein-L-isoaspartate O-methyltransferase [Candidatus Woesearchaeota archaeon]